MQSIVSRLVVAIVLSFLVPFSTQAISINERAGNNFRTAANNQEFTLNKDNVNATKFGLLHTFNFDAKVETQPLVVEKGAGNDDLIIITTMKNEVIGINAHTNAQIYTVKLGNEITDASDMDMWKHTPTWGISATPIIDPSTNTLFVAAWVQKNKGDNRYRDYFVFSLNPIDGKQKATPVRIFGQSQEGNGCWFNDANAVFKNNKGENEQYAYPKLRAGLALTNNHGLVLAFAANGEKFQGGRKNPHGFVVAYDTHALLEQAGASKEPAIFCTTTFNAWGGGIWQAGGAPVVENDTIYVATSNGTSNNGDIDLSESMIKLKFTPSINKSRPELTKIDFYKAFMDEKTSGKGCLWSDNNTEVSCGRAPVDKAGADWDFGPSGPLLIPDSNLLLQGTKDGIIYSLNKTNLGKQERFNQLMSKPPLVASYFGGDINQNWDRANHLNRSIPCVPSDAWFIPCGDPEDHKTHHIHALALAQRDSSGGIVFVWGENAKLKAYNFSTTQDVFPTFRAEGDELASKGVPSPGGMPGGLLMVSGKPSTLPSNPHGIDSDTAILWAIYPMKGDANKQFADAQLVVYDATTVLSGNRLKRLYRTGDDNNGELGTMTRMAPPVVANGQLYVMIYRVDNGNLAGSQLKVFGLK